MMAWMKNSVYTKEYDVINYTRPKLTHLPLVDMKEILDK